MQSERDTAKRELELVRESLKRAESECASLRATVECDRVKRQKLRSSYRKLNESLNGQQDDTSDVKAAMDQLREELMA
jgi:hypothetical protein